MATEQVPKSNDVEVSTRDVDKNETEIINNFIKDGCSCQFGENETCCSNRFTYNDISLTHDNNFELLLSGVYCIYLLEVLQRSIIFLKTSLLLNDK